MIIRSSLLHRADAGTFYIFNLFPLFFLIFNRRNSIHIVSFYSPRSSYKNFSFIRENFSLKTRMSHYDACCSNFACQIFETSSNPSSFYSSFADLTKKGRLLRSKSESETTLPLLFSHLSFNLIYTWQNFSIQYSFITIESFMAH